MPRWSLDNLIAFEKRQAKNVSPMTELIAARNPTGARPPLAANVKACLPPPTGKRVKQKASDLTRLEAEWLLVLKTEPRRGADCKPLMIRTQCVTFKLANGVRYTPDFMVGLTTAYEVKGRHAWDDALVKLKMAASVYPEIEWLLVWKASDGWKQQVILP